MSHLKEVSVNEEDGTASDFVFDISEEINANDEFLNVYDLFVEYKTRSCVNDELPSPSKQIQKEYECVINLFGKDKLNEHPKPISKKENVHHLHVYDGSRKWRVWKKKAQYLRVSNTFLIYSFFVHEGKYYFYLVDFISNSESEGIGGHESLSDSETAKKWTVIAEKFRQKTVQQPL